MHKHLKIFTWYPQCRGSIITQRRAKQCLKCNSSCTFVIITKKKCSIWIKQCIWQQSGSFEHYSRKKKQYGAKWQQHGVMLTLSMILGTSEKNAHMHMPKNPHAYFIWKHKSCWSCLAKWQQTSASSFSQIKENVGQKPIKERHAAAKKKSLNYKQENMSQVNICCLRKSFAV